MTDKAMLFSMLGQSIGAAADSYERKMAESQSLARMNAQTSERRTAFENSKAYADPKYAEMSWEDFKQSDAYKRPEYGHLDPNEAKGRMAEFELNSETVHYEAHKQHTTKKLTARLTGDFFTSYKSILKQNGGQVKSGDPQLKELLVQGQQTAQELGLSSEAWGNAVLDSVEAEITHGRWELAEHVMEHHQDLFNDADQLNRAWGLKRLMRQSKKSTLDADYHRRKKNYIDSGRFDLVQGLDEEYGIRDTPKAQENAIQARERAEQLARIHEANVSFAATGSLDVYGTTTKGKVFKNEFGGISNDSVPETEAVQSAMNAYKMLAANNVADNPQGRFEFRRMVENTDRFPAPLTKAISRLATLDDENVEEWARSESAKHLYSISEATDFDPYATAVKLGIDGDGRAMAIVKSFMFKRRFDDDTGPTVALRDAVLEQQQREKAPNETAPEYQALATELASEFTDDMSVPMQHYAMGRMREFMAQGMEPKEITEAVKGLVEKMQFKIGDEEVFNGAQAKAQIDFLAKQDGMPKEFTPENVVKSVKQKALNVFNDKLTRKRFDLDKVSEDDIHLSYQDGVWKIETDTAIPPAFTLSQDEVLNGFQTWHQEWTEGKHRKTDADYIAGAGKRG